MTLQELMANYTPSASYEGFAESDTWVLAIKTASSQATEKAYPVFQIGAINQSMTYNPTTNDATYVRTGTVTTKTGNQGQISLEHDRYFGDTLQDFLDSYAIVWGTGDEIKADFVYFNLLTGKGIKGTGHIVMNDGANTAAGGNGTFTGTLYIDGKPDEYTWAA